ncbi:MAG TPA: HD domain-containing phosphohydrolase [Gaiellaceae bacterium]|nr:HD domain-containing phosphohydrolase [Gaiellaceae bacterium]
MRLLLVDDDAGLRALLRTTFELVDVEVEESEHAAAALAAVARRQPDVIVLDIAMPGMDGIELCHRLKSDRETAGIPVVLLSGTEPDGREVEADAFLTKPFSPLQLLAVAERLAGGTAPVPLGGDAGDHVDAQLILYARDLRRMLEIEREQRGLLQAAYRETVLALATALDSKDAGTRAHSQRVQRYALELARAANDELADDPSLEYGFLLHDVGKIGIPDRILQKPGPLTPEERRQMETHTVIGEQMLGGVAFLRGEGIAVVRHHHERWDGAGYPDRLEGTDTPLGARIFAVADALDAMTSDRPYRRAQPWEEAAREIAAQSGRQFDPKVVKTFVDREPRFRAIHSELLHA